MFCGHKRISSKLQGGRRQNLIPVNLSRYTEREDTKVESRVDWRQNTLSLESLDVERNLSLIPVSFIHAIQGCEKGERGEGEGKKESERGQTVLTTSKSLTLDWIYNQVIHLLRTNQFLSVNLQVTAKLFQQLKRTISTPRTMVRKKKGVENQVTDGKVI